MQKLLIAIRPEDHSVLTDALGSEFNLVVCYSLSEAKAALREPVDLIACGLHFDDGNLFALLEYVRTNSATSKTPFYCVKGAGSNLTPAIYKSVVIATERMGANAFIDLGRMRSQEGDATAYARLRQDLHRLLGTNAD